MNKPEFLTITGLDERTDMGQIVELSERFPIEWGILFSPNRQGISTRYPTYETLKNIYDVAGNHGLRLSAHVCGKYSRSIMDGSIAKNTIPLEHFSRTQVNALSYDVEALLNYAGDTPVIAQWRVGEDFNHADPRVNWLYDTSGGKGLTPTIWPKNTSLDIAGYAGGIKMSNIVEVSREIASRSPRYWIDIESGARTDDWLDLVLVERYCEVLFG